MDLVADEEFEKLLENYDILNDQDEPEIREKKAVLEISKAVARLPSLPVLSEWSRGNSCESIQNSDKLEVPQGIRSLQSKARDFSNRFIIEVCALTVSSEYVGNMILKMIEERKCAGEGFETSSIENLIKTVNELAQHKKIRKDEVSEVILDSKKIVPLEILLPLTSIGLLSLSKYIIASLDEGFDSAMTENRFSSLRSDLKEFFCTNTSKGDTKLPVEKVLEFITSIIALSYTAKDVSKNVQNFLNAMICELFEEHEFKSLFENKANVTSLAKLASIDIVDKEVIKARADFFMQLVKSFLRSEQRTAIEDAFIMHSDWVFAELSEAAISILQAMIVFVSDKDLISVVTSSMHEATCDFQRLLSLISVWLVSTESAPDIFARTLTSALIDSVELQHVPLIKSTLLVARHCSLQTHSGFPTYSDWLDTSLKDNSILRNRDSLVAYIRCINDLLPVETKDFLKKHLKLCFDISAPSSAKHLFNEYIRIAKIRLCELKGNTVTEDSFQASKEFDKGALRDIETFLNQYSTSRKIPKAVFEMSVFQKKYFLGSFLPALLNPEALFKDENRRCFVETLRKQGKIPSRVYQDFQHACERLNIGRTFSDVSKEVSDLVDVVINKINELPDVIARGSKADPPKQQRLIVQTYLSSLSAHLKHFKDACGRRESKDITLSLSTCNFADVIVDKICQAYTESSKHELYGGFKWVKSVLQMTLKEDLLSYHLKQGILKLLDTDIHMLESYHLHALSCVVATLQAIDKREADLTKSFLKQAVLSTLGSQANSLSLKRVHQSFEFVSYLLFFCSLVSDDMVIVDENIEDDVCIVAGTILLPKAVIEMWIMMSSRLERTLFVLESSVDVLLKDSLTALKDVLEFAKSVQLLGPYKAFVASYRLDPATWLRLELRIDDNEDYVPRYLKETFYRSLIGINKAGESVENNWSSLVIATTMVDCILTRKVFDIYKVQSECKDNHDRKVDSLSNLQSNPDPGAVLPPTFKAGDQLYNIGSGHHSCRISNSLLCFLRSLSQELELCTTTKNCSSSDSRSWLLSAICTWLKALKCHTQDGTTVTHEINVSPVHMYQLCAILDVLPSHLLFTKTLMHHPPFSSLENLISTVNDLALSYRELVYCLPLNIFIRILNALTCYCNELMMYSKNSLRQEIVSMIDHFVVFCPVFAISLVNYFNDPVVAGNKTCLVAIGSTSLKEVSLVNNALRGGDLYEIPKRKVFSAQMSGIFIFIYWLDCTNAQKENLLLNILELPPKTLHVILECLLIRLLSSLIDGSWDRDCEVFWSFTIRLIKKIPRLYLALIDDILSGNTLHGVGELRDTFVSKGHRKLFAMVFMKLFAKMDPLYLSKFLAMENSKHVIQKCTRISSLLRSDHGHDAGISVSPFDVTFLKEQRLIENALQANVC